MKLSDIKCADVKRLPFLQKKELLICRTTLFLLFFCIGIFLLIRMKAFFLAVWKLDIHEYLLLSVGFLLGCAGAVFADPVWKWMKERMYINRASAWFLVAAAVFSVFLDARFLMTSILEKSEMLLGTPALCGCLCGGGLLLGGYILCSVSSAKEIFEDCRGRIGRFLYGDVLFIGLLILTLNLWVFLYSQNSATIYYWDNAGYWKTSHALAKIWETDGLFVLLNTVRNSVLSLDYNYIILLPMLPWVGLFGQSRYIFLASITNMWLLPVCLLLWLTLKIHLGGKARLTLLCSVLTLASAPMLLYAVLIGFIDVGGLVPASAAMFLYVLDRGKNRFGHFFAAGFCLAFTILLRRWFAFWALAYLLILLIDCIALRRNAVPLIACAAGCVFPLLFFFQTFVSGKLMADYGQLYSAYSQGIRNDFMMLFRYFGVIILLALLVGVIRMIYRRSEHRSAVLFSLLQAILCFVLFVRVQNHGQQHLLLYVPSFLCIVMLVVSDILDWEPKQIKRKTAAFLAVVLCSASALLSPFVPRVQPTTYDGLVFPSVLPSFSFHAPKREDAYTIVDLMRCLDTFGAQGQRVGVLASSFVINQDILVNAEDSLSLPRVSETSRSYLVSIPAVDQRDGWSNNIFSCDIIAVADPVQLHLGRENQAVVALPAEEILSGEGIGAAFEKLDESYQLKDGITVYLYRKIRDITEEEKQALYARYKEIHP